MSTDSLSDLHKPEPLRPVALVAEERTGQRPSPSSIWRWVKRGTRGGRLNASYVLGKWHTTVVDFDDFVSRQTAAALSRGDVPPPAPCDDQLRAARLL